MIEGSGVVDDADVFQIIEENQSAETGLVFFRCRGQRQIELSRGRALEQDPVLIHHAPDETGTVETLHSRRAPDVRPAKILLNSDQSQPWSDDALNSLAALEDFVVDSYGSRDPDLRQLFSPEKELRFKTGFRLPFVTVEEERMRVRDLPAHVQEVNSAMQHHVMRTLNPEHAYYICFDQLDLGFDPGQLALGRN